MDRLRTALCGLLEIEYPIVQSGMGAVAGPELVAEVCEAGGLGILAALNQPVDVVREGIRKVRALSPSDGGETPAIALSGYGRPQDRLKCIAAGFNMHVPKPVDPRELTTIIAGIAERKFEV